MSFNTAYNETKALAESFRVTLMNYLVTKRFEKMLQAMQDAANIADTVLNNIGISGHKFKVLSKISGLVLPDSATVTPNDSNLPGISLEWTGDTIDKTVNSEIVKVLPISEITYEPENVSDFKTGVSGKLNRLGVVVAMKLSDPSTIPSGADFHDYRNAYFLPDNVTYTTYANSKYTLLNKEDVEIYIDWRSMQPDIVAETAQIDYIKGQLVWYYFSEIDTYTGVDIYVWYNPSIRFVAQGEGGENINFTINADLVVYNFQQISNANLRVGDYTALNLGLETGMYMLAPIYTLSTGWVKLGYDLVGVS